ncbi:TATA-binding protein-associated factor mot1 [Dispira simplex]|nr:TATA-binding protein-associated factor mot1 [Dispira simplex]
MSSRLDRLILLLDTGSTSAIRTTAAQQIGDIQKQHPDELSNLLLRVSRHLRSRQWETRVAAGVALEAIAQNVPVWNTPEASHVDTKVPPDQPLGPRDPRSPSLAAHPDTAWSFARVDLPTVLGQGQTLLSSAGKEFDVDLGDWDTVERMALQRDQLLRRIGMNPQIMATNLLDDADLSVQPTTPRGGTPSGEAGTVPLVSMVNTNISQPKPLDSTTVSTGSRPRGRPRKHPLPLPPSSQPPGPTSGEAVLSSIYPNLDIANLSARERNRLKRKAKKEGRTGIIHSAADATSSTPHPAKYDTPLPAEQGREKIPRIDIVQSGAGQSPLSSGSTVLDTPTLSSAGHTPVVGHPIPGLPLITNNETEDHASGNENASSADGSTVYQSPLAVPPEYWPFTRLVDQLCLAVFDPAWEVRHGAGLGLKAILKIHGSGAGYKRDCTSAVNRQRNQIYLLDIAVRLVCVLALDRFGDFVSDQVVAPVRETCAQTLGMVGKFLQPLGVDQVMNALLQLVHQPWVSQNHPVLRSTIWEVRYAGLLGLKYVVAVRQDLASQLLDRTVGAVYLGLQDNDDDVRAVSAATLTPMVDVLVQQLPDTIPGLCRILWNGLLELKDDLTPSIASVMDLVSKLYRYDKVCSLMKSQALTSGDQLATLEISGDTVSSTVDRGFVTLLPRLYPFFRHTMSSVRIAVLETLQTFIRLAPDDPWVNQQWRNVDARCLQLVYQNLVLETHPKILQLSGQVWSALVWRLVYCHLVFPPDHKSDFSLAHLVAPHLPHWFQWAAHPVGVPLSTMGMYMARAPGLDNSTGVYQVHPVDATVVRQDMGLLSKDVLYRNRAAMARALGHLLSVLAVQQLRTQSSKDAVQTLTDTTSLDSLLRGCLDCLFQSSVAFHHWVVAVVIDEWATAYAAYRAWMNKTMPLRSPLQYPLLQVSSLATHCHETLLRNLGESSGVTYAEVLPAVRRIHAESLALLREFTTQAEVPAHQVPALPPVSIEDCPPGTPPVAHWFTVDMGTHVAGELYQTLCQAIPSKKKTNTLLKSLEDRRRRVLASIGYYHSELTTWRTRTHSAEAGAIVALEKLPAKLNDIIRSLMGAIKGEELTDLQLRAAVSIAKFCALTTFRFSTTDTKQGIADSWVPPNYSTQELMQPKHAQGPVEKIIKNLCTFVCSDSSETPLLASNLTETGIWSLQQLSSETVSSPRSSNAFASGRASSFKRATEETVTQTVAPLTLFSSPLASPSVETEIVPVKQEPDDLPLSTFHPVDPLVPSEVTNAFELGILVPPLVSDMESALTYYHGNHARNTSKPTVGALGSLPGKSGAEEKKPRGRGRGRGRGKGRGSAVSRTPSEQGNGSPRDSALTPTNGASSTTLQKASSEMLDGALAMDQATAPGQSVQLTVRGATMALHELATLFGPRLFFYLPRLWDTVARPLSKVANPVVLKREEPSKESSATLGEDPVIALDEFLSPPEITTDTTSKVDPLGQEIIDALQVIQTLITSLDPQLHSAILTLLPHVFVVLQCKYAALRYSTGRCLATLANVLLNEVLTLMVRHTIPLLGHMQSITRRQGAAEAVYQTVVHLDHRILPFVIFLVVPVLGRMSDPDELVRMVCTNAFAQLIKLVPLEAGMPDPPEMAADLLAHREHERQFLSQLLDSSQLEPFRIPIPVRVELRPYQQDGVNWLAFLNRYQLHGILCDDMGLGKTLQSICILASDHHNRATQYAATQSPEHAPLPSLVVCPPTLIGHWQQEIVTYVDNLQPLVYAGPPNERRKIRPCLTQYDVIIMSYDVLRNDLEELVDLRWNYCILDEGHIIKNTKTKITRAVKSVQALHRVILSGTPVQNNVLELWSLFDFLMPGFLGTERIFNERYGKPILASRESKSSSRDQEAGALALEALHKQVLPFLLRRMKEDVLHDLPPKIIQDHYCDLSELQRKLYDDFSNSRTTQVIRRSLQTGESYSALTEPVGEDVTMTVSKAVLTQREGTVEENGARRKNQHAHVFQALQYLRKLVNHPLLVLNPKHSRYNEITKQPGLSLHDLHHAPKLLALKQLLWDCGIGTKDESAALSGGGQDLATVEDSTGLETVSQHRALIFCQLKTMLDIVENDLLRTHLPSVTYMRLDGSVDSQKRQDVVQKFNQDPSIDVLLLTTHVGGLGLNLTGADTVIFVEHDWNPMKDLQAMDRAHRLGQKRVVNVYRLITRDTLEEKIMGLQKFKLNVASSIINQQNAGLQSMNTDQLLDLFSVGATQSDEANQRNIPGSKGADGNQKVSAKAALEDLEDLWDEQQYQEEYNLDNFIQSLSW